MSWKAQKLVTVLVTSTSMIKDKEKEKLKWVPGICYLVTFKD